MSAFNSDYACVMCDGRGEVECSACGSEIECEDCDGTGLDGELIDVKAFEAASQKLFDDGGMSVGLYEDKKLVGRANKTDKVYYRDFAKTPAPGGK